MDDNVPTAMTNNIPTEMNDNIAVAVDDNIHTAMGNMRLTSNSPVYATVDNNLFTTMDGNMRESGPKVKIAKQKPVVAEWLAARAHGNDVAHREWPGLEMVGRGDIIDFVLRLFDRCITARVTSHAALFEFEKNIQLMEEATPLNSTMDYLAISGAAKGSGQEAGRAQNDYEAAVMTMRLLLADMMYLMCWSKFRRDFVREFKAESNKETKKEQATRDVLDKLAQEWVRGTAFPSLQIYIGCVRGRLERWDELSEKLAAWAVELADCLE